MRKKIASFLIVFYIIFIFQTTLLDYLKIMNIKPNLILILIICIALIRGGMEGAYAGLVAGLFQDILSGHSIGPYALLGFLVGFALGGFNKRFYRDNFLICALITFIVSVLYESIFILPNVKFSDLTLALQLLRTNILIEAAYNTIVSVPIYIIALRISDSIELREKRGNKY